jgi:hypothetical protein
MRTPALLPLLLLVLSGCRDTWEEPGWMGRSDGELERELGAPSSECLLDLTQESALQWIGHREALWRFAPAAAGDTLSVKEMLWKDHFSTRVAWLRRDASGNWRVFDTLGWRAGVVF